MRKNLRRGARGFVDLERREIIRRAAPRLAAAVRNRRQRVTKQLAFLVHNRSIIAQISSAVVRWCTATPAEPESLSSATENQAATGHSAFRLGDFAHLDRRDCIPALLQSVERTRK